MTFPNTEVRTMQGTRTDRGESPPTSSQNGWLWIDEDTGVVWWQLRQSASANTFVGVGVYTEVLDTSHNENTPVLRPSHRVKASATAPANGIAASIDVLTENASRSLVQAGSLRFTMNDVTAGSEDSKLEIYVKVAGSDTIIAKYELPSTADGDLAEFVLMRTAANTYALRQIVTGANDSGGAGFRMCRVANI